VNYQKIYEALISRAKHRIEDVDGEVHHIIPKWRWVETSRRGDLVGDPDVQSNLVKLTYREHLIAHLLLAKIAPLKYLSAANGAVMFMLSTVAKVDRSSTRKYAAARAAAIKRLRRDDVTEESIFQLLLKHSSELELVDDKYLTVKEISRICEQHLYFSTAPSRISSISSFTERLSRESGRLMLYDQFYRSDAQRDHARSIMSGKVWVTDICSGKYLSVLQADFDPLTMIHGRVNLKTTKGMVHMNNGEVQVAVLPADVNKSLQDGWQLGGLSKKAATKGYTKVLLDGVRDFVPLSVALRLFYEGRVSSAVGRFLGRLGDDVTVFNTLIELRAAGYTPLEKSERRDKVVIHRGEFTIMIAKNMLSTMIEQGWSIGRPGAIKKSALARSDLQEFLK
jgi:hypothetical protein